MPTALLIRRVTFSASHRLHSPELSDAENTKIFGKCNNPNGHGHNYVLEVAVQGKIDPKTGMILNLSDLNELIDKIVVSRIDHKNFNLDLPEFQKTNPTAENIAVFIWKILKEKIPLLHEIKLQETENNSVIYRGE
jgi:6-pyruvoyltetrahydropterin/6-carboxytetrahydropterin synthase